MNKPVILTGLRANNDLHIGNYFGALLPLIDMAKQKSDEYEVHLFVPDLHSFTTPIDHKQLQSQIMHNLRLFVAAGLPLDNPHVHIYRQSYIPAHSELTIILNSFTSFGEMGRMTQFKDKSSLRLNTESAVKSAYIAGYKKGYEDEMGQPEDVLEEFERATLYEEKGEEALARMIKEGTFPEFGGKEVSVGLFDYPVLMAADILLYGAQYVPVGDDQTQHLEFTRDIAERMNAKFGQLFTVPEPVAKQHEFFGKDQGLRIKDLQDPTKKMSKSDETGKGIIFLGDSPQAAAKKIMSAATDSIGAVHFDYEKQPGVSNLLQLHALLSGETIERVAEHHDGQESYGALKKEVAEQMQDFLAEFQKRLAEVDEVKLMHKLESDEFAMNERANATLERVQRAVGLRPTKSKDDSRAGARRKPHKISFDHFTKVDVRIGTVTQAEKLEGSDKLIKLQVDLGPETRQILTGMQEFYAPEDFVGKQVPVLVNLAERTMMGEVSQGMLLALQGEEGPVFLTPDKPLSNGSPLE